MIEIITLLIVYFFDINLNILMGFLCIRWVASGMLSFKRYLLDTELFDDCFYQSDYGVYMPIDFKKGVKNAKKMVLFFFIEQHILISIICLINSFLLAYAFLHKNYYINFNSLFKIGIIFFLIIIFSEFLGYIISMKSSISYKKKEYRDNFL